MQLDFTPENLDRYFKKQLSESEQRAVEQKISQDPLLKSEIDFQQEVIEAICQRRKWEIKQRLDALAPETSPLFSLPRIAFGTTLTIAGLLTATLFWFDSKKYAKAPQNKELKPIIKYTQEKEQVKEAAKITNIQPNHIQDQKTAFAPTYTITQNTPTLPVRTKQAEQPIQNTEKQAPCLPEAQTEEAMLSKQDAFIKLYDEMLWFEVNNTDTDNGAFNRNSEDSQSLDRLVAGQMLRYQYYNGQLSLYNNASAGKQIHTTIQNKERHFLLYEGVYYEFFDGQIQEIVMQPVRDRQTLTLLQDMVNIQN